MKTSLRFPVQQGTRILVELGEKVKKNQEIATFTSQKREELEVARVLKVVPNKIIDFLKKVRGKVNQGEVIAEKKGLLSKKEIKSPFDGEIEEIDLKKGTLTLLVGSGKQDILSPVDGKIVKIEGEIEIAFSGEVFLAREGKGKGEGPIRSFLSAELIRLYDLDSRISGALVLIRKLPATIITKVKVLEAAGIVTSQEDQIANSSLPYLLFSEKNLEKIGGYDGNYGILNGEEKRLIIPFI